MYHTPVLGRTSRSPSRLGDDLSDGHRDNQHLRCEGLGKRRGSSKCSESSRHCRILVRFPCHIRMSRLIIETRILGVLIDAGLGFKGLSIGTYNWYHPGAIHHGFWGFCSVMITAAFAYSGSEMVGLTAREQVNPRRDMPKAIKKVFIRIGIVSIRVPYYLYRVVLILIPTVVLHCVHLHDRLARSLQR